MRIRLGRYRLILLATAVCCVEAFARPEIEQDADKSFVTQNPSTENVRSQKPKSDGTQSPPSSRIKQLPPVLKLPERAVLPTNSVDAADPRKTSRVAAPPKKNRPNEGTLWRLYEKRQFTALEQRINGFKRRYPNWSPPRRLLRLIDSEQKRRFIRRAEKNSQWKRLIAFARKNPGHFNCRKIDAVWALATAYAEENQPDQAARKYRYLLHRCASDRLKLATLQKAGNRLSPIWMEGLWLSASHSVTLPESREKIQRIRYEYEIKWFMEDHKADSGQSLAAPPESLVKAIKKFQDGPVAIMLGWYYFNRLDYQSAQYWFDLSNRWQPGSEESLYGLALSLTEDQQANKAEEIAREIAGTSSRGRRLLGEILLQQAWTRFERQEYPQSRLLATEALGYADSTEEIDVLLAWLDYRDKNYKQSLHAFEKFYQDDPRPEVARGLALSHAALNEKDLPQLAESHTSGPLSDEIDRLLGQELYWRKRFLAAHDRTPDDFPKLANIDSAWLSAGALYRYKSGDTGMSRLDIASLPILDGVYVHEGVHRFGLQYDLIYLDSKTPRNCASIGRLPVQAPCQSRDVSLDFDLNTANNSVPASIAINSNRPLIQNPTTQLNVGHAFEFSYLWDGWYSPYASIGMTPLNGAVSPRPTFRLGFSKQYRRGVWGVEFYSQPVRESILSYTGINDPYSNTKWGRVLRTGATLPLLVNFSRNWTFAGNLDMAALYGEQVKTNWTVAGSMSLGYDFNVPNFDYFTLGPAIGFQHFNQNQNHFTLGHGGYFSPDHFFNIGMGLNFLTQEARSVVLKGRIDVGYQNFYEARSPWFPLGNPIQNAPIVEVTLDGRSVYNDAPFYAGNSRDGISYGLELKGVWLAHPNFQIGGGVAARRTSGYDDYSAGLFFRFLFEDRKASFSSDIPDYLFQKLY